jgi:diguanylate cyclase (GGDEF)-like protein
MLLLSPNGQYSIYWNRVILNVYWFVICLYTASQFLVLFLQRNTAGFDSTSYITYYMVYPDAIQLVSMLFFETAHRIRMKYAQDIIVYGSILVAVTTSYFITPNIHGSQVVLILPLLVSMLSFKNTYMVVSSVCSFLFMIVMQIAVPLRSEVVNIYEFILVTATIAATAFTGFGVIRRGKEFLQHLEKSLKSEQELLIKNVLMDRDTKIDALTGLYNHKTYHEYVEKLVDHSQSDAFHLALAVMDVDNFKKVNDIYGHWVGDLVLKQVAARIREHLGSDDFAARYGGEEFVVIFVGRPPGEALAVAETIRRAAEATPIAEMDDHSVTISIGLHVYVRGEDKETFFRTADAALYEAKKNGKNKTFVKTSLAEAAESGAH